MKRERHPLDDMIYVQPVADDGSGELIVHVAKGRVPWRSRTTGRIMKTERIMHELREGGLVITERQMGKSSALLDFAAEHPGKFIILAPSPS